MKSSGSGGLRASLLATAVLAFAGAAAGQQFKFTNIWVPGSTDTIAVAINDYGTVVGSYETSADYAGCFMESDKAVSLLHYPGSYETYCNGINNSGEVVGSYVNEVNGTSYAFQYQNGVYTNIGADAAATGINNVGQIVGWASDYGFILQDGVYQYFQAPNGAVETRAEGINDSGQVTVQGYFYYPSPTQSWIYDGSTFTEILHADNEDVITYGINNGATSLLSGTRTLGRPTRL